MFEIEAANKILIVDDAEAITDLLTYSLSNNGNYEISVLHSGEEAVEQVESIAPDLILLDVIMPGIDGFETADKIKQLPEPYCDIPIIFITGKNDVKLITKAFDIGAVDYISKPLFPKEVQARIKLHLNMASLLKNQAELAQKIDKVNKVLLDEQLVAKEIFDNLVDRGCLEAECFKSWISSASIFNGDMLLSLVTENNNLYVMLGDFTGHGLPAAIGVIPASDAFYSMSGQDFDLKKIVKEINKKLNDNLPHGVFCATAAYHIDLNTGEAELFNGSIPGSILTHNDGSVEVIPSQNLPLGILKDKDFEPKTTKFTIKPNERIYLYTDGIVESKNPEEELFGNQRVLDAINKASSDECFDTIIQAVQFFAHGLQEDDITLLEYKHLELEAGLKLHSHIAANYK